MRRIRGISTRAVHAGEEESLEERPAVPSLVMSNTFLVDDDQPFSIEDVGEDPPFIYTRWGNPTVRRLERKVAALEGADSALAFGSGMAAAVGLFQQLLKTGDHLVTGNVVYAGVAEYQQDLLRDMGVEVTRVDTSNPQAVAGALRARTRLVFVETPCNPILRLTDIAAVAAITRAAGVPLAVDSTFATPIATRPLELGADYVMHSMTKYMGGHGDAVGGIIVGGHDAIAALQRRVGVHGGAVLSPFNAWLMLRGLATLPLRMRAHEAGATAVARFLEAHSMVEQVIYPGLASHPQHALAARQMENFGGMLTFRVAGGRALVRQLAGRLEIVHYAVSLGHHKSLIYYLPTDDLMASSYHLTGDDLEAYRRYAGDGIFRLSVGLEDPDDLCADLAGALESGHHRDLRASP